MTRLFHVRCTRRHTYEPRVLSYSLSSTCLARAVAVNNMHVLRGKAATIFFNRPKSFQKSHPLKIKQKNVKFVYLFQKLFKRLYNDNTVRVPGSLAYYRNLLRRTNVNGQVKGRYQSHLDFLLTCTEALIVNLAMTTLGVFLHNKTLTCK